jgi:hypothetical protein
MRTINLYGERGVSVLVDHDWQVSSLDDTPEDELTRIVGHRLYTCSIEDVHAQIIAEARIRSAAATLGRKGGQARTERQNEARRANGAKGDPGSHRRGGRPRKLK